MSTQDFEQSILRSPEEVIPHRAPFLFLREVDFCSDLSARGRYSFSSTNPIFAGHFPERPIVPGVLILEGAAQVLAYWALLKRPHNWVLLTGVEHAKWSAPVYPDQEITYHVEVTKTKLSIVIAEVEVFCGEQRVLKATIKGFLQRRSEDDPQSDEC